MSSQIGSFGIEFASTLSYVKEQCSVIKWTSSPDYNFEEKSNFKWNGMKYQSPARFMSLVRSIYKEFNSYLITISIIYRYCNWQQCADFAEDIQLKVFWK